ncbi:UDP-3-O-(3-hydroxymyristoyl)glucosamine N-acyltransferase [Marivibrio halodurans]|uniref:UDP-3-O-acylglucosamine N-acyltransferase n=1 Tax=Marivibrio halodurans TaxID=2039722 RepID=A0A8J7RYR6_9PROT|nr:UDP-3-O-(3-hydroxymyristoyl)glucosamine N-acyltransferase [Marivibrio halodurans]
MADPRFFHKVGPFTAGRIAEAIEATVEPADQADRIFSDTGTLEAAGAHVLSFFENVKYKDALAKTKAGGVVVRPDHADRVPAGAMRFLTPLPYRSFALAVQMFYPDATVEPAVDDSAWIAEDAIIGTGVRIEAGAVIEEQAEIADGCWIQSNAVVGRGCRVGAGTRIGRGVVVTYALIGERCRIYAGTTIGTRGFGFAMDRRGHIDLPQLGRVVIGDDVEIGANCSIDRGMSGDTEVGNGTRIDNLVHIGHNVRIGKGCVLCAQVGIAGSAVLEDFVVLGGQVGIGPHSRVGTGVQMAAKSGSWRDVEAGAKLCGVPAVPIREFHRRNVILERLSRDRNARDDQS